MRMNATNLAIQDLANHSLESSLGAKHARSEGTSELFAATQAQSARVLSDESAKGDVAHTLYIASVQRDAFHEISETE